MPSEFINGKSVIKDKKSIANGFNDFFVNIGQNLAKTIPQEKNVDIYDYLLKRNESSMFINPVDEKEVLSITQCCSNKTSIDCNDLSMTVVKHIIDVVVKPFQYICNLSFEKGVVPRQMKIAKVVPLYKSGNKSEFNNYRPVSLLPHFSKILQKPFDSGLQKFIDKYKLLNNSQYGFRSKCSTSLALLESIESICSDLDEKKKQQ